MTKPQRHPTGKFFCIINMLGSCVVDLPQFVSAVIPANAMAADHLLLQMVKLNIYTMLAINEYYINASIVLFLCDQCLRFWFHVYFDCVKSQTIHASESYTALLVRQWGYCVIDCGYSLFFEGVSFVNSINLYFVLEVWRKKVFCYVFL